MSDKDFEKLMEIAHERTEAVKTMNKTEAIATLHRAGIVNQKGEFTRHYKELKTYPKVIRPCS